MKYIYFEFTDGSNPYIFRGTPKQCDIEFRQWGRRFFIEHIKENFYLLTEKEKPVDLFKIEEV